MVAVMNPDKTHTLVLGLGNTLLSDEQVGVRVAERVGADPRAVALGIRAVDGGTMGLTLLVDMENAAAMVVIDAAALDAPAGTVRVFEGVEMDRFLRTRGRNPHDIGLDDVLDGLRLRDAVPQNRALIGIQPATLTVGEHMTPQVAEAVAKASDIVLAIVARWKNSAS